MFHVKLRQKKSTSLRFSLARKASYQLILFLDAAHKKIIWLTDKLFHVKH